MMDKIDRFHHVTLLTVVDFLNKDVPVSTFTPRIPQARMCLEDDIVPRVCIAPTLEGCIKAIPQFSEFKRKKKIGKQYLLPYRGKKGYVFRVYDFEIHNEDKSLIESDKLKIEVPDALNTGECWYLEQLIPSSTYHILVLNLDDCILRDAQLEYLILDD